MKLTVVTPTYNEAQNLPKLVEQLFELSLEDLHLLIVDDGSPDGTGSVADSLASGFPNRISVIHRSGKLGLGTAYLNGFSRAIEEGAQFIAQMDADLSHPPDLLVEMLETAQDYDVAMGSRYVPGGGVDRNWPVWRKSLSAFGNYYASAILGFPIKDATSGFKIWRREVLENMPLEGIKSNGYAFQVEMAYVAYRLGFTFKEVPFYFADRSWGDSKMSFKIQWEAAFRVWQMRFDYKKLSPIK